MHLKLAKAKVKGEEELLQHLLGITFYSLCKWNVLNQDNEDEKVLH